MADPRQTPIARTADLFLPLRSGTGSALLNGILHIIIKEGLIDEDFIRERTVGWEETKALVEHYPPERVAKVCGLRPEAIVEAARMYGKARAALIYTARGLEHQSKGVDNGVTAINLALATGNFGRPGAGYGRLTGQGNGQGGREVGQKASQLPGCREIEDPEDRAYICSVWGIDEKDLPHAGYPATLMIPAMLRQEIRACLMICSNPMVSLPDQHTAEQAFRSLDLFVVMDFFLSETAELADIVLPGNVWAEDEGTTTSLEGRVIKYNKAVDPPGEARLDWQIVCDLARRLGKGQYFAFHSAREIFDELRLCTRGAKSDYWGITYEKIDAQNGVFWPCPTEDSPGTPRLYEQRFGFPDGKARFHPIPYIPPAEEPDEEYPLVLTTGRVIYHYLSGNQTRRTPFLREMAPYPWVEMHERTAEQLGIRDGEWVTVRTRRGEMTAPALVVRSIRPDTLFIPYHYGHTQAALGNGGNGVFITHLVMGDQVGRTAPGTGNVIVYNGKSGVLVGASSSDTQVHIAINQNAIFANGGLGIDLAPQGVVNCTTPPPGPNDYTPCPVIQHATTTQVSGTACANCMVEVFIASAQPNDQGHGEGKKFLGRTLADASGNWSLTLSAGQVSVGQSVTATATTPAPSTVGAETSEFATNLVVASS